MGNTGKKFAIGTVDDFLNIESSVCVTPRRRAFRDIAPILFLSSAVSWPAKAGSAYAILDMIRPVNVCNANLLCNGNRKPDS